MNGWSLVEIEDLKAPTAHALAMGPFGSNITTSNFVPIGVPVVRGGNLSDGRFKDDGFVFVTEEKADELRSANAVSGDLVFTHRGTLGQVGIIPRKCRFKRYVVSQSQMKLSCDKTRVEPLFLFYYFRSPEGQQQLLANTSTTGVPAIASPLQTLRHIQVSLPPLSEQRAIAAVLGSIDDKIELNRQLNQTLEEFCRALFTFWFVNFGPVRAKADGLWKQGEELPGMPADMWDLWPSAFERSEIGNIPAGWPIRPLAKVVSSPIRSGVYIPKRERGRGAKLVNMGELFGNPRLVDIPMERVPVSPDELDRFSLSVGDLLFARRSMIGTGSSQCSLVSEALEPMVFESSIIRVRPDPRVLSGAFLFHYFWSSVGSQLLESIGRHGPISGITGTDLGTLSVFVPPSGLQERFGVVDGLASSLSAATTRTNYTLSSLRDALLPKLLSGEVRVPIVEDST